MKRDKLIAVVDDEADIRDLVDLHLQRAGFSVVSFEKGNDFLSWLNSGNSPSLCVLDVMLPDLQGTDICRQLRNSAEHSGIPVIMLTALDHETDRVTGLELGADDYVTKPFSPRELVARVRAVLRRVSGDDSKQDATETVSFGAVEMDPETYIVTVGGRRIDLTSTEFRILYFMANSPGRVFSRSRILDHLWGGEKFVFERTVDVHIRHIREKLGEAAEMVQNVRGIGYRVGEPDQ